jgi:hypothetical protein
MSSTAHCVHALRWQAGKIVDQIATDVKKRL